MPTSHAYRFEPTSTSESPRAHLVAKVGEMTVLVGIELIEELIPRVAIQPLPGAPHGVQGTFNHRGSVGVVIDMRERFGVPAPKRLWDALIVLDTQPKWALLVDSGAEVVEGALNWDTSAPTSQLAGLVLCGPKTSFVVDPAKLLDASEVEALRLALAESSEAADGGDGPHDERE